AGLEEAQCGYALFADEAHAAVRIAVSRFAPVHHHVPDMNWRERFDHHDTDRAGFATVETNPIDHCRSSFNRTHPPRPTNETSGTSRSSFQRWPHAAHRLTSR